MPTDLLQGAAAVLFDLDDTLLDYAHARDTAVVLWAREHDVALSGPDLVARWAELEETHFARYALGELTITEQRRLRVRGLPGLDRLDDDAVDAAFGQFITLSEQHWAPLPGAVDAVRRVARSRAVGVLTNGAPEIQTRKLALLGLVDLPLFASVATGIPKPQAEAFLGTCRALGVDPGDTVMVGDNLTVDVHGALNAGLRAIWVDRSGRSGPAGVPTVRGVAELG